MGRNFNTVLFSDMYSDLEQAARCDLSTRQRNKKDRMERSGSTV